MAVSECGTHAITSAVMGPYETSENALADQLLGSLGPGLLCLADRGFYSFERFQAARETGAQLLWRAKSNMVLPRERTLADGSYLTRVYPSQADQRAKRGGAPVRVVDYRLEDPGVPQAQERYRLLSTLLMSRPLLLLGLGLGGLATLLMLNGFLLLFELPFG